MPDKTIPPEAQQVISLTCDSFEAAWVAGQSPQIETVLDSVDESIRPHLLEELITLEAAFRRENGESPTAEEYAVRFPNSTVLIKRIFDKSTGSSRPTSHGPHPLNVGMEGCQPNADVRDAIQSYADSKLILARTRLRILRKHAEGGLGQVAIALDQELSREIAFKEIQPKYANITEARNRFVREAQITGGLEHPGIVPIYGIGQYDDGRPFYVMRFIQGDSLHETIQAFHDADQHGRDPSERRLALQKLLGRFLDVCHAIGYAHSRGILHRDLKPGNIMLGEYGETLVVDWGLAKSVGQGEEGSERELLPFLSKSSGIDQETRHGSAIGTPAFMSPEQAAGNIGELGPATDVYALGATLYTILTGQPPIEQTDNDLMLAKVIAGDFLRPREINRSIPKPLEAICLKAMANDPANRYASTVALANDIEHYLADERVAAHRESWIERTARLGRRYKTFTRAVAISLIAITAISIAFAFVADYLRGRAVRAEASTSRMLTEKTEALKNEMAALDEAEEVRERFIGAFRSPNPELDGRDVKVVDVLDRFVDELEQDKDMPPTLKAALTSTIGRTYSALGRYKEALPLHEEALRLRQTNLGMDHPQSLTAMNNLAIAYQDVGTLDRAVSLHEETLKWRKEKLGPDHPETLSSMNNLALAYTSIGKLDKALPLYEETRELATAKLGADHLHTLKSINNLANAYKNAGKLDLAIPLLEDTLKRRKARFDSDHPDIMTSMASLANAYKDAGKPDLALPLYEEALTLRQAKLGPDHPDTLASMNCLANAYKDAGKLDQALPLFEETLKQRKIKLGANHTGTLITMNDLGNAYMNAGALDKGLPLLEETLKLMEENFEPNHPYTLSAMNSLAAAYKKVGKLDKALPLFEKTLAQRKTKLGPDHPSTLVSMNNLALAYKDAGKLDQAGSLLEEALQWKKQKHGPDHPSTLTSMNNLALVYKQANRFDKAIPLYEETLKRTEAKHGMDHPATLTSMNNLAAAYSMAERPDEARPLFEKTMKLLQERRGPNHPHTLSAMNNLAMAYAQTGKLDQAISLLEETFQRRQEQFGQDHPDTILSMNNLAEVYLQAKDYAKAEHIFRESLLLRRRYYPDHWMTSNNAAMLGTVLTKLNQYAEAETLLLEGIQGMEKQIGAILPAYHSRITDYIGCLIELYESMDQPYKATQWHKRLESTHPAPPKPAEKENQNQLPEKESSKLTVAGRHL